MIPALHATETISFAPPANTMEPNYVLIGVISGVIFLIIFICAMRTREIGLLYLSFLFPALVFIVSIMIVEVLGSVSYGPKHFAALQTWAVETYRIVLTEDQAEDLLINQIDIADSAEQNDEKSKIVAKNSYGDVVEVALVHDKDEWFIIQYGIEPPVTIKEVK